VTDEDTDVSKQDPLQRMINSFIVKIWLTNPERRDSAAWRGQITHVSTQERRYLKSLEDITEFIKPFLQRMGVRAGSGSKFMRWLHRKPGRPPRSTRDKQEGSE
jgi:hypothetical protein